MMKLYWIFAEEMKNIDFASKVRVKYMSQWYEFYIKKFVVAFIEWAHQAYVIDS